MRVLSLCIALLSWAGPAWAEEPKPLPFTEARGGVAELTPANTVPLYNGTLRLARVTWPDGIHPARVLGPNKTDPGHQALNSLYARGLAAGNSGDLYDNRDRGHSRLDPKAHPQFTHIRYGDAFRQQDYGLAGAFLTDRPLIGNSSTALTQGIYWRSLPRIALTRQGQAGANRLYQAYLAGQIYVYPENRDHDPDHGDLIPANTPYFLISQGSSNSDLPHMEALAMIYAAYRPETKAFLHKNGLLAATTQMVYRRARQGVRSREAYLSGGAHPAVFRGSDIQLARMVGLANAILPDEVPPLVQLKVLEETRARPGIDYFGAELSEVLFDTPSAIARIWRMSAGQRSMLVSATGTRDPNGRELRFDWVVLRGDPQRIAITPLPPDGSSARIDITWQDPGPVPGAPDVISPRIDIGVFANNGRHDSAPAFVSILLPRHETRVYETTSQGMLRPVSIDRQLARGGYADPAVFPDIRWRDSFHYRDDGSPNGWTRHRPSGTTEFTASGYRLGPDGLPHPVRYSVGKGRSGLPEVLEQSALP